MKQFQKRDVQISEADYLTVGDWIVHLLAQTGALPQAIAHSFEQSSAMPKYVVILDIIKWKLYVAGVIYLTSSGWVVTISTFIPPIILAYWLR